MSPDEEKDWIDILRGTIRYTDESLNALQVLNRYIAQARLWPGQTEHWKESSAKQIENCFKEIW